MMEEGRVLSSENLIVLTYNPRINWWGVSGGPGAILKALGEDIAKSGKRSMHQAQMQRYRQARTKFGHRMSELCNALTGGGFSLMGFGSFCAKPNDEPTGLFPEVMPAYLQMMPECVDTRDTAPALALEAPFPTVKCRLVRVDEVADSPTP